VPIGTVSTEEGGVLTVRGAVLSVDGKRRVTATHTGLTSAPLSVGQELAAMLLGYGAGEILDSDAKGGELLA
jgi:hydroxymethylbilane synthase